MGSDIPGSSDPVLTPEVRIGCGLGPLIRTCPRVFQLKRGSTYLHQDAIVEVLVVHQSDISKAKRQNEGLLCGEWALTPNHRCDLEVRLHLGTAKANGLLGYARIEPELRRQ